MDPHALPNTAAGGMALVAAMETVDRVVRSFTEDFGRAVAVVRAEVSRERDAALALVDSARAEVEQVRVCLHLALFPVRHKTQWRRTPFLTPSDYLPQSRLALLAERERFDTERMRERAELDRAWQVLSHCRPGSSTPVAHSSLSFDAEHKTCECRTCMPLEIGTRCFMPPQRRR